MRRHFKKLLVIVLGLSFFSITNQAFADGVGNSSVTGHATLDMVLPFDSLGQFSELLTSINVNSDEMKQMLDSVKVIDGKQHLKTSFKNIDIKIGTKQIRTDSKGNFDLDNFTPGKYQLELSMLGKPLLTKDINLQAGKNKIDVTQDADFGKLVENHMSMMSSTNTSTNGNSDMSTMGVITPNVVIGDDGTYHGHSIPWKINDGTKGNMVVFSASGIVSCNKSDWDNGKNFPNNISDCAKAVAGGVAYSTTSNLKYYQGFYCLQEAMGSVLHENVANVYCNEKAKLSENFYHAYLNAGYNCSSFTFINSDERLNKYNF